MTLEHWALIVSIVSAGIAIGSFLHAVDTRRRTRRETVGHLEFIEHLVVNSAADPDTVRRMVKDYHETGVWRAKVSKTPDGKYHVDYFVSSGGDLSVGGGDVKLRSESEGHKD